MDNTAQASVVNIGGLLPVRSLYQMREEEQRQAEQANAKPLIQGLAQHVWQAFTAARDARQQTVEPRMLKSLRQRRGEYDPEVLAEIRKGGGSEIYMMLTSNKCRAAASWISDVLLGSREDKPWTLSPTKSPDLSPEDTQDIVQRATEEIMAQEQAMGMALSPERVRQLAQSVKDEVMSRMQDAAQLTLGRMECKMEDQLQEGGFISALAAFVDDLVTSPAAIMKGPVVRKRPRLAWGEDGTPVVQEAFVLEWERVDPFMFYPAAHAANVNDGPVIERHRLTRGSLNALIGVPGYNDAALHAVLDEYGTGGLNHWLAIDQEKAAAEGKAVPFTQPDPTIDALQYWGSVSGQMLLDWGHDGAEEAIDPAREYECEVWLIGRWVIKAVLNPHPLGKKDYYKSSYEEIPGSFWGNSIPDLIRDCQAMCNAAARALADNMGISSGPQVWVNNDRLADGEGITQMYPWKIWQTRSDPYGASAAAPPLDFFQPSSNAAELMGIYEKFSVLADEYSGLPRYMTGSANVGGAGRTASGMSMLMNNAGKGIKYVFAGIDTCVIGPLLERLYQHNMQHSDDPDLKGDVRVVARGVNALAVKEQAQVRRNEFLNIVLTNPTVAAIVGEEAVVELLREVAKTLDMNTAKLVPSIEKIRARMAMQQAQAMQQQAASGSGQELMDGAPVVDNFAPMGRA